MTQRLTGLNGDVYITGSSVAFTNEAMTDSGDETTYYITNTSKRFWDDSVSFTVQTSPDGVTWTTQSVSTYTIQYVGGAVIFHSAQAGGTQCRVSGSYLTASQAALAYSWELSPARKMNNYVIFGSTWEGNVPSTGNMSVKVARYWSDAAFASALTANTKLVLVLFVDSTIGTLGARWEAFAFLKETPQKTPVDALVTEDATFQITGQPFYYPDGARL